MPETCIAVALPLPFQATFTYRLPAGTTEVARGARVVVPFGNRRAIGVALGKAEAPVGVALKDVVEIIDDAPLVEPPLVDLAEWMAEYYLAPPGECLKLLLPPAGLRASRAVVRLAAPAVPTEDPVLAALCDGPLRVSTLAHRLGRDPAARLLKLRQQGAIELVQDMTAPGFRLVQVAVLADASVAAKGKAQAEVLARLGAADGRARVADLVHGRPSLRSAVTRLA